MSADSEFKDLVDGLVARVWGAWDAEPEERRGVELLVSLVSFVVSEHVLILGTAGMLKLRSQVGFPPLWTSAHAIASLSGLVFTVTYNSVMQAPGASS